ncbi:MAG: GNAT family N-acetyltransferase [Candidatus Coproplasma sp.]
MYLRIATRGDYAAMLEIYRPYVENTTVSFEYVTPTLKEFTVRMDALTGVHPIIVCEDGEGIIGYAYSSPAFLRAAYGWCADLSVYVRGDMLGRGAGSALSTAVCSILQALGYRKVYSLITEGNQISLNMHAKCGFKEVAFFPEQGYKAGKWIGVRWLERTLNDQSVGADNPKKIADLSAETLRFILNGGKDS